MDELIFFIILGVLIAGCGHGGQSTVGNATLTIKSIGNTTIQKYRVNDVSAMDLLKFKHDVKLTFGDYLECIDDVCANKEYVWTFYVNDAESSFGVKQYMVKDGDKIEFKFNKGG